MMRGTQRAARLAWACSMAVAAALLALAVLAAPGSADVLSKFTHCPKENPEVNVEGGACVFSKSQYLTTKWKQPVAPAGLQAGNVTIPFVKPLVLQGGFLGLTFEPVRLVGPEDGAPLLTPVAQPVPGGLSSEIDVTKLHGATLAAYEKAVAKPNRAKVTATVELAPAGAEVFLNSGNLLNQEGTFLTLPLKMKFSNEFLGEDCYAGSDASPILVELTDGTTSPPPPGEPISGQLGQLKFVGETHIAVKENSLVSNTFEAPGVQGCGREAAWQEEVDEAINSKAGLPSPPGSNSTRINGTQLLAGVGVLREHGF
jgi:hypothetical protein